MSNFANPELTNNFRQIVLASNVPTSPAVVFANDPTVGLYWDLDGIHLTGLSATPTDNTEAASKAYVDAQSGGGSGANTALSNLISTAVNMNLVPGVDATNDLGAGSFSWHDLWLSNHVIFNNDPTTQIGFSGVNDFRIETNGGNSGLRFQPTLGSLYIGGVTSAWFNSNGVAVSDDLGFLDTTGNYGMYIGATSDQSHAIQIISTSCNLLMNDTTSALTLTGTTGAAAFTLGAGPYGGTADGTISLRCAGIGTPGDTHGLAVQIDGTNAAHEIRLLLWDVDSGALQRVTVGAADSGGTGFKVLRIPN